MVSSKKCVITYLPNELALKIDCAQTFVIYTGPFEFTHTQESTESKQLMSNK